MLFPKRQDFLPAVSALALGSTTEFKIPRTFFIDAIYVIVTGTTTTGMASANADSLQNIVQNISLQVSDGSNNTNIVDASGAGLLEYSKHVVGSLDRLTQANIGTNTTAAFTMVYPLWFGLPQLSDPIKSMFLLPVNRFPNDPVLRVRLSTQAEMDVHGTPTFAATGGFTIRVVVVRRQPTVANWAVFRTELVEQTQTYSTSAANQLALDIPALGSYTGILIRGYQSGTTRGDISTASGEWKLQLLGTTLRRFQLPDLQIENDFSVSPVGGTGATLFTASYFLDFLNDSAGQSGDDFGSTLDANATAGIGVKAQLIGDIAGGSGVKAKYVMHRVWGDIRPLVRGLKIAAG